MAWRLKHGASNYNFVDLTGQILVGCTVLGRAPNTVRGNAAWCVRAACGHRIVIQGITLRAKHKSNPALEHRCKPCR